MAADRDLRAAVRALKERHGEDSENPDNPDGADRLHQILKGLRTRRIQFPFDETVVELGDDVSVPRSQEEGDAVAEALSLAHFPLKRHVLTEEDADRFFEELKAFPVFPWSHDPFELRVHFQSFRRPHIGFGHGRVFHLLKYHDGEPGASAYERVDRLSDFFSEHVRMEAMRAGTTESLAQAWRSDNPEFRRAVVREAALHLGSVDPHALREAMWRLPRWAEVTAFKPSFALSVMRKLGAVRVLDFSAGWGDRLLAALAHGAQRYVGVDPNTALEPGHSAIVRKFGGSDAAAAVRMVYAPFEEADLHEELFDTVFTSPPYFDFEVYNHEPTQSCSRFPSLTQWLAGWLLPTLQKAWQHLRVGGHLAVHMCDRRIVEPMLLMIDHYLPCAHYVGVLACTGALSKPRPTWVYIKTTEATEPTRELQRFFPELCWRIRIILSRK